MVYVFHFFDVSLFDVLFCVFFRHMTIDSD